MGCKGYCISLVVYLPNISIYNSTFVLVIYLDSDHPSGWRKDLDLRVPDSTVALDSGPASAHKQQQQQHTHTHTHTYARTMYTEDPAFRERPCRTRMNPAFRANSREHVLRTDQHFRDLLAAILVDDVTSKKQ